jgi:hypothetical protein
MSNLFIVFEPLILSMLTGSHQVSASVEEENRITLVEEEKPATAKYLPKLLYSKEINHYIPSSIRSCFFFLFLLKLLTAHSMNQLNHQ